MVLWPKPMANGVGIPKETVKILGHLENPRSARTFGRVADAGATQSSLRAESSSPRSARPIRGSGDPEIPGTCASLKAATLCQPTGAINKGEAPCVSARR